MNEFLSELKRRNVIRMAGLYLVGAWLLVQVAGTVLPMFGAPDWIARSIVILLAIGLVPALVFSWVFELTPQGLKRDEDVRPEESIAPQTARRMNRLIIAVLVLALGYFAIDKFVLAPRRAAAPNDSPAGVSAKSIAVLPFENLSEDKANAYFAEGIQDEILTRLAKIADLKVISRTSTQHFKSSPDNLPQIARQLGVAHILEGSVQKANDQVRVNVQLINAATDAHLWADTYDRKLTDIFAVESDIAKTIADTLQAKLTGSELTAIAKAPTANNEAYELYLKGRFFWNKRTGADLLKSIDYFNQAIAQDPNYALAYAGLADSYLILSFYGAVSPAKSYPQAKAAAEKALELDNALGEPHASLGLLAGLECDNDQSIRELERAIQLNPNYATAHHWLGLPLMSLGQFDRAIAENKRAIELDPLSLICNADLSWVYLNARRYDDAEAQARKTLEMDSGFYLAHYYLGLALQFEGKLSEAIVEYQKAVDSNGDPYSLAALGQAYARNRQMEKAQGLLARLRDEANSRYVAPYALALLLTALGEKEQAIGELEGAYRNGTRNYLFAIKVDPLLDDLRGDPRFEALVQKVLEPKAAGKP